MPRKKLVKKKAVKEVVKKKAVGYTDLDPLEVEKPKKKTIQEILVSRKEVVRKTFLECVKENDPKTKFDFNRYINGSSGKGLLCDALGAHNPYDRALFQEILIELREKGTLYHIGGAMYVLR
jgi:hypothetical protein